MQDTLTHAVATLLDPLLGNLVGDVEFADLVNAVVADLTARLAAA